jgi:hypothetical protein
MARTTETRKRGGAAGAASSDDAGAGAKEQAQAKAGEVKDQAQEKARGLAADARGRAVEQVEHRSTQAGAQVSTAAGDVRSVGEELRKQGKDGPAKIADQAAERAEKLGNYLQDSDAERILGDVEDFGRRQPWAVIAGGLALGFLASRFLKASSQQRYRSSYGGGRFASAGGVDSAGVSGGPPYESRVE